jgi:cytosine/adenosine deaminase-related metal-dependent hydrolase
MSQPPVPDGAVWIAGDRIRAVGRWRDLKPARPARVVDLGEVLVLPGLVNAHCHLDYTDLAGCLPPPRSFTDWIKHITRAKDRWTVEDFRRSWLRGAQMLLRSGCTAVADVEAVPELLPGCWNGTPLRVISFLEMTGIRARRDPRQVLAETLAVLERLQHPRCSAGLSPHAPYSTRPELLRMAAQEARRRGLRLTIHVAESEEEFAMFHDAAGPMYDWLLRHERDMQDCGGVSPVQHLHRTGCLGANLLAVHANCLARGDAALLARHNVTVVHCPRSHRYFGHPPFPWQRLLRARVRICVGTDSLASVRGQGRCRPELSLFDELQELQRTQPWLSPIRLLRMVTLEPARALGLQGRIGELVEGAFADLTVLPGAGVRSARQAWEAAAAHEGPVESVFIGGVRVWPTSPRA